VDPGFVRWVRISGGACSPVLASRVVDPDPQPDPQRILNFLSDSDLEVLDPEPERDFNLNKTTNKLAIYSYYDKKVLQISLKNENCGIKSHF
jgi:hypothetical protein